MKAGTSGALPFGEVVEALRRSTVAVGAEAGGGSGVVVDARGGIVTNAHVARAPRATVDLWDGRRFEATVRGRNPGRDLALLEIESTEALALPAARLGDSERLRPGEVAIAIGNPMGFRGAMSAGVIHAVASPPGLGGRRWVVADLRLAPGNSGGPLADAEGRVVGINTMVSGRLAFAVPSSAIRTFFRRFLSGDGEPRLGVLVRPILLRERGRVSRHRFCIQILEVEPGSAAATASLRRGDLLVAAEGEEFLSLDDLDRAIASTGTGLVHLEFRRGDMGKTRTVSVQLGPDGRGRRSEAA